MKHTVTFDELNHTYTRDDGKMLSGVTGILIKYLFTDMYTDVPAEVLSAAAEYGSLVHSQIQMLSGGFPPADELPEVTAFKELGIDIAESEMLVTDGENIASSIDIVDTENNLYDIKTTAVLNREYLSWQLSIYAYLFEQCTGKKANKLSSIHLRGDNAKIVEIKRIDDAIIKDLINAFVSGAETFTNPLKAVSVSEEKLLAQVVEIESFIINLESKAKAMKSQQQTMKDELKRIMDERGITKWETDSLTITRKADSVRKSIDSDLLKTSYPEVYDECLKETKVSGTILIKIANN